MNTSLGALAHPVFRLAGIIAVRLRGPVLVMGAALLLSSCSALRLGYHQAHSLLYWWIDAYADLDDAQTARLRRDIDRFMAWHRREELPAYADRLHQWQALATQDLTADQVCAQVEHIHGAIDRLLVRGHDPLARLALTLSADQLDHLQHHFVKKNGAFEEDFLRGNAEARLSHRTERALDRYETLYGPLSSAQRAQVRQSLQASPFDAARSLALRRERQADLLQRIPQWQAGLARPQAQVDPVPAAVRQSLLQWLQGNLFASPQDHSEQATWVRQGCQAFADLHNRTSPEQRRHAQRVLQEYEADLRILAGAD